MPQLLGQWQHLLDDVPGGFLLVLQHVVPLASLLFLELWYCTGVLPPVDHTCFLCSGPGGVASLVPLIFWCIFSCCFWWWSCLDWTGKFLLYVIRFLVWIQPWRWVCLIFHPWKFSPFLHKRVWGGDNASLYWILVSASKIWDIELIALSWASSTWKGDSVLGVCKAFARSAAACMAISLVL